MPDLLYAALSESRERFSHMKQRMARKAFAANVAIKSRAITANSNSESVIVVWALTPRFSSLVLTSFERPADEGPLRAASQLEAHVGRRLFIRAAQLRVILPL